MESQCKNCSNDLSYAVLTIIDAHCWSCKNAMKVAVVRGGADRNYGGTTGPDGFSQSELVTARDNGVFIKEQHSKTMDETYIANTCKHCNAFIGNFFLHKDYLFPASAGEMKYTEFRGEPYCEPCIKKSLQNKF